MMRPVTKLAKQIVNGNTIPSLVREAFRLAEEERPGPVHLELPEDIAAEMVDDAPLYPAKAPRRPDCSDPAIDDAVAMIRAAEHPLLLVGAGANRKWIIDALETFVAKTGIPFFNTQMGKGVISGFHELYIGTAALSDGDYLHCAIDRPISSSMPGMMWSRSRPFSWSTAASRSFTSTSTRPRSTRSTFHSLS